MRAALIGVTLAVATCLAPVATASSRPAPLSGSTTLTGDATAAVEVTAPRAFTLRDPSTVPSARTDLTATGGAFSGFVLRSKDGSRIFTGGTLPGALRGRTFITAVKGANPTASAWTVPAGRYTLTLLATAKNTTVTLRLGGLQGANRLKPTSRRVLQYASPEPQVNSPAGRAVAYGAGAESASTSRTLLVGYMYLTQPLLTEIVHTTCFYIGKPVGPAAYAPGCPGTAEFADRGNKVVSDENTTSQTYAFTSALADLAAGTYGLGMNFVSASGASDVGYQQYSVTY